MHREHRRMSVYSGNVVREARFWKDNTSPPLKMDKDNGMGMWNKVIKPCYKPSTSSGSTLPLTELQLGSVSAPDCPVVKQEKEPHKTHSFTWCYGDKKPITATCSKAGTVEDVLRRSSQFKEIAGKNRNKVLAIVKDGKAISSHFPCSLIKKGHLIVKYIKAIDRLRKTDENRGAAPHPKKRPSGKPVMFHVLTKGGKNVVQIMRNPELRKEFQEMTVYAYKGEKVKQALKRDGRLMNTVFSKNCALSNTTTEEITEMLSLVDDLNGKTFKIILLNKDSPPDSEPSSQEEAYMMPRDLQRFDSDGNQDPPHESTNSESGNDENPKLDVEKASDIIFCEIPHSKQMWSRLSSQLKYFMKKMKTQQESKLSRIQNLFRVEYGKSDRTCREVKTMKELMKLSDLVCQVRANGRPEGSGFLLFDKFVLTNGHVVKNCCRGSTMDLIKEVTVHSNFESLNQPTFEAKVVEVVGAEYYRDVSGQEHDWALLRFETDQTLPDGLLTRFGFIPQDGGICIIGHPGGGVKMIDPCWIVPTNKRRQVVERHQRENPCGVQPLDGHYSVSYEPIQLITDKFFNGVAKSVEYKNLTYESCFYYCSSGSPVFDADCNVVAMHTGGFAYRSARAETSSVIEFGHPLSVIIERIIIQMVETKKFDVLKKYLACDYKHKGDVMKKLFERADIKKFFEHYFQGEELVPMDTD